MPQSELTVPDGAREGDVLHVNTPDGLAGTWQFQLASQPEKPSFLSTSFRSHRQPTRQC